MLDRERKDKKIYSLTETQSPQDAATEQKILPLFPKSSRRSIRS
ncbi:2636_t:CDS:2 [Funneliformis caledonium]|uniref:2636_t:CDS:1 n=1 Tax=Funneliformis caledonium TaxID=1117310 RepID=A0A9N8V4T2_9GLOM|nr:2636_t:CDS:2 [Funneliformis caledonium]